MGRAEPPTLRLSFTELFIYAPPPQTSTGGRKTCEAVGSCAVTGVTILFSAALRISPGLPLLLRVQTAQLCRGKVKIKGAHDALDLLQTSEPVSKRREGARCQEGQQMFARCKVQPLSSSL